MNYIPDYQNITEIPEDNQKYLDSSLKVNNMELMFHACVSLTSLDLPNFDTSNVTDTSFMFGNCRSLTSLDLSNFDTSNVTDMNSMFGGCSNLTIIIGSLDMSSCASCSGMFTSCRKLKDVHLKNVPHSLDLSVTNGTEGATYIIDNYID